MHLLFMCALVAYNYGKSFIRVSNILYIMIGHCDTLPDLHYAIISLCMEGFFDQNKLGKVTLTLKKNIF